MIDEKHDRSISGYQGSGSSYICVLCGANHKNCKEKLGTFKIDRNLAENKKLANYVKLNPDHLSEAALSQIAMGLKSLPISLSEIKEKLMDATHADINLGRFFQKLVIRLIAGIDQWDATSDVSPVLKNAEHKFDLYMKHKIGVNPSLMMPGNYARTIFDVQNEEALLGLLDDDDREHMQEILEKLRFLRSVYRAKSPAKEDVSIYKEVAVEMGKLLIAHYNFARWPNYLHKVLEHVQEILEDPEGPGSIGAFFSSEGNEAGNKLFRLFRKHYSNRGDSYKGLEDVLKLHWLYSSLTLGNLAKIEHRKYKCSKCSAYGHSKTSCKAQLN